VIRKNRKVVTATVPARRRELGFGCPYVVLQLQKSAGSISASNKVVRSAPKRVAVRVNGGLGGVVPVNQHESVAPRCGVDRSDAWRSAFIQVIR